MNANKAERNWGFTVIELMIVVGIVSILLALAYPSYVKYVRKANRGEAQQLLMNWSINQEIWRSNNSEYATIAQLTEPCKDNSECDYDFRIEDRGPNTFTLYAKARSGNDQENDTSRNGTPCIEIWLDQNGVKQPAACWE